MRHKHADAIIAWAEGKEIEYRINPNEVWQPYQSVSSPSFFIHYEYRIKPTPPKWYENIPERGVLCWVRNIGDDDGILRLIFEHNPSGRHPYIDDIGARWNFAHPLSNDEIQLFIRSNNND